MQKELFWGCTVIQTAFHAVPDYELTTLARNTFVTTIPWILTSFLSTPSPSIRYTSGRR